jgi:hypothetical protein
MPKGQQKSNKEVKKPKKEKPSAAPAASFEKVSTPQTLLEEEGLSGLRTNPPREGPWELCCVLPLGLEGLNGARYIGYFDQPRNQAQELLLLGPQATPDEELAKIRITDLTS